LWYDAPWGSWATQKVTTICVSGKDARKLAAGSVELGASKFRAAPSPATAVYRQQPAAPLDLAEN